MIRTIEEIGKPGIEETLSKKCGICKGPGPNIFWPTASSRHVHEICYQKIKELAAPLLNMIQNNYENPYERNLAHSRAIYAVTKKIGTDMTIDQFIKEKGIEALGKLFENEGLRGAFLLRRSRL